jgi:hypothetical protein
MLQPLRTYGKCGRMTDPGAEPACGKLSMPA